MSTKGSPYPRFQRALKTGNLAVIRNAAAELPRVELGDALSVCMAIREAEPDRLNRAALRWLARYAVEKARDADDVHRAAAAFTDMPTNPDASLAALPPTSDALTPSTRMVVRSSSVLGGAPR